jgi:peptidyl-prolyl cis-trans isomerase C
MPCAPHARVLVVASALACAGPACRSAPAPAQADAGPARGGLTPEQRAQVLARVGDHTITLGDYEAAMEHLGRFDRLRYQAPERRKELLHEMIDVTLLADEARARGYDKDPIAAQELREILRDAYFEKARAAAPTPAEIPDPEVRAYYDAHKGDFHDPERRRVSVIVLPGEAAAGALLDAARKSTPAQWGELVRGRSLDPQAKANVPVDLAGDLGFVGPPGDDRGANPHVPDEVRAAVFEAAAVGDVVPRPVKAGKAVYLVRFSSRSDAHDRTFADAERAIRVKLAQDALRSKEEAMLRDLRSQFPVEIDEQALAGVKVDVPADASVD